MKLFPTVQSITYHQGSFTSPNEWIILAPPTYKLALLEWMRFAPTARGIHPHLLIKSVSTVADQGYHLLITKTGVIIETSSPAGAFYGIKTLIQIVKQHPTGILPCLTILDAPSLPIRGYMLDISRNKIPEVDTIKRIIDLLADLKYNHLELYVEGFSFAYPSLSYIFEDKSALTIHEYERLELYARQRFIDLVPCHNGLGHMTAWLARPEFADLAVIKEGMYMWGAHRPASTINPLDQRSIQLVKSFYKDALLHSTSNYFHMNLDEPYELGQGKTKEVADRIGVGQLYLNYVKEMATYVSSFGRTPLIWGDVLNHYPEMISKLPKNMIFVDWGYDHDYPFHATLERLSKLGVSFIAAPGTSTWNSLTGRTYDMLSNIHEAASQVIKYHGVGLLLTDWGDNGHLQPLCASFPGIVYAALEGWRQAPENAHLIAPYINQFIVEDTTQSFGQLLLDAGTYYRFEPQFTYNATAIMAAIWHTDEVNHKADKLVEWQKTLHHHPYADATRYPLIKAEVKSYRERLKAMPPLAKKYHHHEMQLATTIELLDAMIDLISLAGTLPTELVHHRAVKLIPTFTKLQTRFKTQWLRYNKVGELAQTLKIFDHAILLAQSIAKETNH